MLQCNVKFNYSLSFYMGSLCRKIWVRYSWFDNIKQKRLDHFCVCLPFNLKYQKSTPTAPWLLYARRQLKIFVVCCCSLQMCWQFFLKSLFNFSRYCSVVVCSMRNAKGNNRMLVVPFTVNGKLVYPNQNNVIPSKFLKMESPIRHVCHFLGVLTSMERFL